MAALQIYTDKFGPYPYREMSIVQAPLTFKGMEFPSLSLIGSQVYSLYQKDLENLVIHEVAHQWWYNQVGSDQVRESVAGRRARRILDVRLLRGARRRGGGR